jgi:hypothetical protein
MMKLKSVFICVGVLVSSGLFAQTEMQTLFGKSKNRIQTLGLYIAPEFSFGQYNGSFSPIIANSLMLSVNKKFAIGATASKTLEPRGPSVSNAYFGGLKTEYTPKPDALIHVSFPVVFGGAVSSDRGMRYFDNNGGRNRKFENDFQYEKDESFLFQPGVNAETNIFKYGKLFVGANYRLALNESGYNSTLSGFSGNLGLKLGVFDYALKKRNKTAVTEEEK